MPKETDDNEENSRKGEPEILILNHRCKEGALGEKGTDGGRFRKSGRKEREACGVCEKRGGLSRGDDDIGGVLQVAWSDTAGEDA